MKKFYYFINMKNISSLILPLTREARAPTSSSVPDDVLHPRIITPMLATQRETLLRHVFVRPRQNERREREERSATGRDFHRPFRVPGSSRAKIGHTRISL